MTGHNMEGRLTECVSTTREANNYISLSSRACEANAPRSP